MMTERAALLRAIEQHPHDDLRRLILADWLEEYGDQGDRQWAALIRDEAPHQVTIDPGLGASLAPWAADALKLQPLVAVGVGFSFVLRRGFVETVRLRIQSFLDYAHLLDLLLPILRRVEPSDRNPARAGNLDDHLGDLEWFWYRASPHEAGIELVQHWIPASVFDRMPSGLVPSMSFVRNYPTREAAMEALSDGCLKHLETWSQYTRSRHELEGLAAAARS